MLRLVSCSRPLAATTVLLLASCESGSPPTADGVPVPTGAYTYDPSWQATQDRERRSSGQRSSPAPKPRKVHALPTAPIRPAPDDPLRGHFTLDDAVAGLKPGPRLLATIRTSMGVLTCDLWPDRAPLTVANFVGLARGIRPWKTPAGNWERKPAYDGTSFHRVIPGFVVQAGSPTDTAADGPGYAIADEIWEGANHDRAGLLCMATTGKNTGGMQFFITDAAALHLDGSYPIFGRCGPVELIHAIAATPAKQGRPIKPIRVDTVAIARAQPASPPDPR